MTIPRRPLTIETRTSLNVLVPAATKQRAIRLGDLTGKSLPALTVLAWELLEAHVAKQAGKTA